MKAKTKSSSFFTNLNPLPQGRGFFTRNRLPVLTAIKALLITMLVIIIDLGIVSKPDFISETATIFLEPPTPAREIVVLTPAQKTLPLQPEQRRPSKSHQSPASAQIELESPVAVVVEGKPVDWLRMLYPELVRIAELNNYPVDMAIAELLPMLDKDDPAIRLAVIQSLGDMTTEAVIPALLMALSDPDPQIREAALDALASGDDASAVGNIEALLYDPQREVRLAAIEALADLENEDAVNTLAGLLGDTDSRIRGQAVNALGEIGGETAISFLLQARYDSQANIRANADAILQEMGVAGID